MKVDCAIVDGFYQMTTIYEHYESEYIRKCVWRGYQNLSEYRYAECKFYNEQGEEICALSVPNEITRSLYERRKGIAIDLNNIYIPCVDKYTPGCISLINKQIRWKWTTRDFDSIYVMNKKIYADWLLTTKGGIKIIESETGEIVKEVMAYNTKHLHPDIYRLNEQYLFIYSQGGIFLLDMASDKMFMSKKIFKDMHEDVRVGHIEVDFEANKLKLSLVNVGLMPACGIDNGLGWEYKDINVSMDEILDGMKESPLGIKIPTTKAGVERAYKKLFA